MEDNTSTEQPVSDPILAALTDTEDNSTSTVNEPTTEPVADDAQEKNSIDETSDDTSTETETTPEVSANEEESTEDLQPLLDEKEVARRRYEERQALKAEREQRILAQTKDYVTSADDDVDQRLRNMEVQAYNQLVSSNEDKLISEFERAVNSPELQMFNPDSDQFNQKAYDIALKNYHAGYIEYDTNGNMVSLKGSLYEHLKEQSDLLSSAVKTGAFQQVRATKKMKSEADIKPAAQPKEQPKDSILDILKSDD